MSKFYFLLLFIPNDFFLMRIASSLSDSMKTVSSAGDVSRTIANNYKQ